MLIPQRIPRWADGLWLALLAAYILAGDAIAPFHGDESTLIHTGQDYHHLFVAGDLSKILYDRTWSERVGNQYSRLIDGTVSKLIYGWLAWQKGYAPEDLNEQWHWMRDYEFNRRSGRAPDAQLLQAARMASALQLALAAALFFQTVNMTLDRPTAYLASALFALHPNVLINGRRAMMEGSHLLGLMLVLLAGVWLLRARKPWAYAFFGAGMGFAVAAKHPNVIACALVFMGALWAMLWQMKRAGKWSLSAEWKRLMAFAAPLIIALLVFLLLNPAWWSAPLELPPVIIELRAALLQRQVELFGGYNSFAERVQGFFQFVFAVEHQYFEVARWAEFDVITAQIQRYEASGLAGLLVGGTAAAGLACLALALFGAVDLARNQAVLLDDRMLLLVWIAGTALVTLLITPLPWARYYLPLAPALAILVAHAIIVLASRLKNRYRNRANGIDLLD